MDVQILRLAIVMAELVIVWLEVGGVLDLKVLHQKVQNNGVL